MASPHLHGGAHAAKLRYEWAAAHELWAVTAPYATLADLEDREVLDAGCGWGGKALRYAQEGGVRGITGFDLAGLYDPAVPMAAARERGLDNCSFVEGSAERMPFVSANFDVCILDDVMEHVADPTAVMRECERVLRPGGLLIVKFPSIRMLRAHHLDRALAVPGLHYAASLKTWAAGLNDWRDRHPRSATYQPFDETVPSRFSARWVTRNLNGLDLKSFRALVDDSAFDVRHLGIKVVAPIRFGLGRPIGQRAFHALAGRTWLHEAMGSSIVLIGTRRNV